MTVVQLWMSATPTLTNPYFTKLKAIENEKERLMSATGPVDDDAPEAFAETDSGLNFRILRKSDGEKATANNSVTVNYRGWLDDGTEFDSSYKRGEPISFPLGGRYPRLERRDATYRCRRNDRTDDSR